MSLQLASISASLDNAQLVAMTVDGFEDRSLLPFETVLSTLLTKDNLTWQMVTSHLLHEFGLKQDSRIIG